MEVHWDRRTLDQLRAKAGHLEAKINELIADIGDAGKGAGGTDAAHNLPAP